MKPYLVLYGMLSPVYQQDRNIHGGRLKEFDDLDMALDYTAERKLFWEFVCVFKWHDTRDFEVFDYQKNR